MICFLPALFDRDNEITVSTKIIHCQEREGVNLPVDLAVEACLHRH